MLASSQLSATKRSQPQPSQRTRAKPCASTPQPRNRRIKLGHVTKGVAWRYFLAAFTTCSSVNAS